MTPVTLPPTAYGLAVRGIARAWDRGSASGLDVWLGWLEGSASMAATQYGTTTPTRAEAR